MAPATPAPLPLNQPTPALEESDPELDLTDSAELKPENLSALLARAKRAGSEAAKKTRMAFDTTKALADTGLLNTKRFHKKKIEDE
jgi:hypothetical protein